MQARGIGDVDPGSRLPFSRLSPRSGTVNPWGNVTLPRPFFSISPSYPWTDGDLLSLRCTHSLLLDPLLPD